MFNIGREQGTWMPKDWAVSGERLRFQVVLDLTKDPWTEEEEFFVGEGGADKTQAKVARVVEAFVFPHGTVGRVPLKVKATGGYKVVPKQGPMGTDIVRMFVELEEEISVGDVSCPTGRVYGTCGYFGMDCFHHTVDEKTMKEKCHDDWKKAAQAHEDLQSSLGMEEESMLSWKKIVNMKKLMDSKDRVEKLAVRYREARQREPDLNQVRPSRKGDVALSREGGVCCKINKGLSLEYHILGRMELASIDVHDEHDKYQELIHTLRP